MRPLNAKFAFHILVKKEKDSFSPLYVFNMCTPIYLSVLPPGYFLAKSSPMSGSRFVPITELGFSDWEVIVFPNRFIVPMSSEFLRSFVAVICNLYLG